MLRRDIQAANKHFATFIQLEKLNASQITFVQKIIDYLNKNGVLDKHMLTQPPFTDLSDDGIFGVFDDEAVQTKIIRLIDDLDRDANTG